MTTLKRSCMASLVFLLLVLSECFCSLSSSFGFDENSLKAPPAQNTAPTATPTPDQAPASLTPSSAIATHSAAVSVATPTPAPAEPVSSSNPVIYSGSFINQRTGEQGDLVLKVQRFIDTGDGQIAFGGKLTLCNNTSAVNGSYSPATSQISFARGTQSQNTWLGNIDGEAVSGKVLAGGAEQGLWQAKRSGGLSIQQAEKVYGGSTIPISAAAPSLPPMTPSAVADAVPSAPSSTPSPTQATHHRSPVIHRTVPVQAVPVGPRYYVPRTVPAGPRFFVPITVPAGSRYVPVVVPAGPR